MDVNHTLVLIKIIVYGVYQKSLKIVLTPNRPFPTPMRLRRGEVPEVMLF